MANPMLEQFDAWHKSELAKLVAGGEVTAARYMEGLRGSLLCAWQASRDAVSVELPDGYPKQPYANYEGGWNDMREESKDAIEAQGLKVKP